MNNKLNYNILLDLSKNLATGLFPYVFANKAPKPLYNNYSYSHILPNNNLNNLKASKIKKKVLYATNSAHDYALYHLNYKEGNSINYNSSTYFKGKQHLKLQNKLTPKNIGKENKTIFISKTKKEATAVNKYNRDIYRNSNQPMGQKTYNSYNDNTIANKKQATNRNINYFGGTSYSKRSRLINRSSDISTNKAAYGTRGYLARATRLNATRYANTNNRKRLPGSSFKG